MFKKSLDKNNIVDPKLYEMVEMQKEDLVRIKDIVKVLRDYSRIDDDTKSILNTNDLIEKTVTFVKSNLMDKGIQFETKFNAEFANILGVEGKFQQVFMNLITNARVRKAKLRF